MKLVKNLKFKCKVYIVNFLVVHSAFFDEIELFLKLLRNEKCSVVQTIFEQLSLELLVTAMTSLR